MAKLNSTGTGSRRNTHQPIARPSRIGRTTRSQSRDDSEAELPRYSERVQRKPRSAGARRTDESGGQTNTRGSKQGLPEPSELPTVNEDPTIVIQDEDGEDQDMEMEAAQEQLPNLDTKSSGRLSGISGTTARISNSTQELAELALEDLNVLDALPDLSESSKKLLSGLLPVNFSSNTIFRLRSGLQDKRSGLNRKRKRFTVDLESCHPDQISSTFIDISKCLPSLQIRDYRNVESDAITLVFQVANLAILASNILLYPHQENAAFLKNLDAGFPNASMYDENDQRLAINTRIQYAIEQLAEYMGRPNFDHDVILNQVFYNEDGRTLRGYNIPVRQGKEYRNALADTQAVIKRMRNIWTEESPLPHIERLRDVYRWDEYVADMMVWLIEKYNEVQAALEDIEVEGVIQGLKETLKEITSAKQSSSRNDKVDAEADGDHVDLSSYSPPTKPSETTGQQDEQPDQPSTRARELAGSGYLNMGSPRLARGAKSLKRVMARHLKAPNSARQASRNRVPPPGSDIQVASTAIPVARASTPESSRGPRVPSSAPANLQKGSEPVSGGNDDEWTPHANDNDGGLEPEQADEEEDAFQTQQTHEENAERVMRLMESREAESNKENQAESSRPRPKKHMTDPQKGAVRLGWDSQNMSQDGGFQHRRTSERHPLGPISKRNTPEPPETTRPSPAKRARLQAAPSSDDDDIQTPQEPPRISQVYNIANEAAKRMTALQPKAPQTRKPWTEEETERLLELIVQFGTSWKELKHHDRNDEILIDRDQVALKDKARNMKFDFLKAGRMLPRHFDRIALSKPLIERLSGLGIVYDSVTGTREDAEE